MRYLANASSMKVREAMVQGWIGMLATPAEGRDPGALEVLDENGDIVRRPAKVVAFDNGCYGRGYPGEEAWLAWLRRHQAHASRSLFATAPDVLGDAAATLARSAPFLPVIRQLGYPAALVAQNGLTPDMVPWAEIDALFLGGSAECRPCGYIKPIEQDRDRCPSCHRRLAEWKLSAAARALTAEANRRELHVHMGRVNSGRRVAYGALTKVDSLDGTFLKFGPDKNLARLARWFTDLEASRAQTALEVLTDVGFDFGGAA